MQIARRILWFWLFGGLVLAGALSGCGGGGAVASEAAVTVAPKVSAVPILGASNQASPQIGVATPVTPSIDVVSTPVVSGGISVTFSASRVTGVAPLSVFFDASASTSSVTTRPFHDLEYKWSFGDGNSGVWSVGSRAGVSSRNLARGPLAAHVFETPGTYNVTVTASDGSSTAGNTVQITVQDPDAVFSSNTVCFSSSGNFTGCPVGAVQQTTSNYATAINNNQSSKKRLLFRRGETFTGTGSASLNVNGPGIVGAFGTGAAPRWTVATGNTAINMGSGSAPGIRDWRVMDIEIDGQGLTDTSMVGSGGAMHQVLLLRLNMHDHTNGITLSPSVLDYWNNNGSTGHTVWDQWAVVDTRQNTINRGVAGSGMGGAYLAGTRLAFMGNDWDSANGGEHVLRMPYVGRGVISNNYLARPAISKHNLKLHASGYALSGVTASGRYSEKIVISDNSILGGSNDWPVAVAPQNSSSDERIRDVIFERNYVKAGTGTTTAFMIRGPVSSTTIRNNIVDLTGANGGVNGFSVGADGIGPLATAISYYNNTIYSAGSHNITGFSVGSTITNVAVKNNLGYAPNAGAATLLSGSGGAGFSAGNNSSNSQFKSVSPLFSSIPAVPSKSLVANDFKISSGSYAATAGESLPVPSDFFLNNPLGSTRDIGAVIH